jgi:hypothetical protein
MKTVYAILLTVFSWSCIQAQVSEIKSASSSNSSGSNSKSGEGGSYDGG